MQQAGGVTEMQVVLFAVVAVAVAIVYFTVPYWLTRGFRTHRIARFIPVILALVSSGALALKANYFGRGFSAIPYVVLALAFLGATGILLVVALAMGFLRRT